MKTIPNFSTFALTNKDQNVVNVVTGKIKSPKTGTNKYQLFDDNKKSHTLTIEQIKALTVTPESKPKKTEAVKPAAKEKAAQVTKTTKVIIKTPDVKGGKIKKHEQCYRLHLKGKTIEQIMSETDTPMGAVKRNIWLYTTGKKTLA